MDFHCEKIQRAKKSYRYHSTGALIKPGDQYYYLCGVYEGDFYTCRMHTDCYKIYEKLNNDYWKYYNEPLYFDNLLDCLYNITRHTYTNKYRDKVQKNKNFLRNLAYARRIAKLEGVPGWFVNKFSKKN